MPPGNPYGYIGNNPLRQAFVKQNQIADYQRSPFERLFKSKDEIDREKALASSALQAGNFAGQGEAGYAAMTGELARDRAMLRDLATGKNSLATEQLRQGLGQQQAAQMSMAASASPSNAPMAARTAMMNMNRQGTAMAGQAAMASLAERNAAIEALNRANLSQRGQDIEVGLGSRQNEMTGLGANKPDKPKEPTTGDKIMTGIGYGLSMFSDERLKKNMQPGDKAVRKALANLSAKTYEYKNEKHGKGTQLGIKAQDLERAGLKQAVVDTPEGKAIDVGKLAGANMAMTSSLAKRIMKLEKGRK